MLFDFSLFVFSAFIYGETTISSFPFKKVAFLTDRFTWTFVFVSAAFQVISFSDVINYTCFLLRQRYSPGFSGGSFREGAPGLYNSAMMEHPYNVNNIEKIYIYYRIYWEKIQFKQDKNRRENVVFPYGLLYIAYTRPSSQSTETPRISANAANSLSETGLFWPSSNDNAGILISMPETCSFASNSTCFIPILFLASVTRAPMRLRSPSASFRVFRKSPSYISK